MCELSRVTRLVGLGFSLIWRCKAGADHQGRCKLLEYNRKASVKCQTVLRTSG